MGLQHHRISSSRGMLKQYKQRATFLQKTNAKKTYDYVANRH
jgi:hypothetical protein